MNLAPLSRRRPVGALTSLFLSGLCASALTPAQAQSPLTTVASFSSTNGSDPSAVTFDSSGNLFGTTEEGGADSDGTVFEIAKGSTSITTLAYFNITNSLYPNAGVTFDSSGNLFGTTFGGGANGGANGNYGTVFEIAGAGSPAAVPEASTTVSFGLLLMLGLGGVVLARRKRTPSAA